MHATIIRHKRLSDTILACVITIGAPSGFISYVQTYSIKPDGDIIPLINSHPWADERSAILEFDNLDENGVEKE